MMTSLNKQGMQVNTGQTAFLLIEINVKVEDSRRAGFKLVPDLKAISV